MRKLKFGLFSLLLFTYIFPATKITLAEDTTIEIPEQYFTNSDINEGNKSNVILNDKGTDGYGLFFLGDENTDIQEGNYELSINETSQSITCSKQLIGYYTNNFLNFKIFPIYNNSLTTGVTYQTGGLYYECNSGETPLNGVYGYVTWTYKSGNDVENTHKIVAGITGNTRSTNSPLQLVNSGSFRALSGQFKDYLGNQATVTTNMREGLYINYPDVYFTGTATFSGNQNNVYFNDSGNNGFGVFFLGTGIEGNFEITDTNNTTLSCSGQINGYYSFSFNDFGMLPLDSGTQAQHTTTGINYITGGLYYNCRQSGTNTIYTGVYGYIKREYNTSNSSNIHEIRAGVTSTGKFINNSPIELIYSDNFRNINRALSGQYHDNLAKNSQTEARLFGDLGIIISGTEYKATGTIYDPYILLPIESYINAQIYVKSSKENTSAELYLTAIDIGGQTFTTGINPLLLTSQRTDFGFYAYGETETGVLSNLTNNVLESGSINVVLYNGDNKSRSQKIRFVITDSSNIPTISVTFSGVECSKTGVTITATSSGDISYAITGTSDCSPSSNYNFIDYPNTGIYLTGAHIGKYVCFRATYKGNTGYYSWTVSGIDIDGPTFQLNTPASPKYECETGNVTIKNIQQVGCATIDSEPYSWDGTTWSTNSGYEEYSGGIGSRIITGYVRDSLGNTTLHTGQLTWNNSTPQFTNHRLNYGEIINTTTTLYTDLIIAMGVTDGNCGSGTISKTGSISCNTGSAIWSGNGISVTPPISAKGTGQCSVNFADDEGNIVTGYVQYEFNTQTPIIQINGPVPEACSIKKTISATCNGGDMWFRTGNSESNVCNENYTWLYYTSGTQIQFNNENDNGTRICFKAVDSNGNTGYAKKEINNIDTTPPEIQRTIGNEKITQFEECSTIVLGISATDYGCGSGQMTLNISYTGKNITVENRNGKLTTGIKMPNTTGDFSLNVKVTDSVGNVGITIPDPIKIDLTNVELTGTSFNLALDRSGDNEYIATGNWKRLTEAKAGDCETIMIDQIHCNLGQLTTGGDNGELIIYTYNGTETGLYCNLTITDGDSTIQVTGYFINCDQTGNDGCKPSLNPKFTGGEGAQYVHHIIDGYDLGKYTSGTDVFIQINGKGVSKLSGYRYTCVQQGRYCINLNNRTYPDTLSGFIQQYQLNNTVQICTQTGPARSDRISYNRNENGNDTFNIDLNGSTGACDQTGKVYASKFEGTRRVWIELEDIKGYTGLEPTDYIVYSKESPSIDILSESEAKKVTPFGGSEKKPNIPTINSGNVTVNIIVNGANLPTGESGLNYQYESQLSGYGLLTGTLWFDSLYEWLITHYGNGN